jgi:hypothetical protein
MARLAEVVVRADAPPLRSISDSAPSSTAPAPNPRRHYVSPDPEARGPKRKHSSQPDVLPFASLYLRFTGEQNVGAT